MAVALAGLRTFLEEEKKIHDRLVFMDELQQAKTVALKACSSCRSGLLDYDNFCRWCGACQSGPQALELRQTSELTSAPVACNSTLCSTVALAESKRTDVYRRISGPLVNAVATGALVGPSAENQSPFVRRVILALISIPIWLIIVLLSPLDAYAAVKNLARQV
jgi:hypothetical protein